MNEPKFYLQLGDDQPVSVALAELKELAGGVWLVIPMPTMLEEGQRDDDEKED